MLLFGNPSTVTKHSKGTERARQQLSLEDLSGSSSSESAESHEDSTVELIKEIQMLKRQLQEKTRSGKFVLMYVYWSTCSDNNVTRCGGYYMAYLG